MNPIVNVAYCQTHAKGNENGPRQDGAEHAEWLEQAVAYIREEVDWPIVLSITGFPGICHVEAGRERDALWRLMATPRVGFITMAANPSHQHGAAWCIRQGLEFCGKLGYDYMVHTAEDIIPFPGKMRWMVDLMERDYGVHYVGECWGEERRDLNSQFFAVRVQSLVPHFDPPAVSSQGFLERYLAWCLRDKGREYIERNYHHSHCLHEWRRLLAEEQAKREAMRSG